MKKVIFGIIFGIISIAFVACGGIDDTEIGFRDVELENDSAVKLKDFTYNATPAGESKLIERAFENAPPMISHDVEGMMDITKDVNMCITCHAPEFAEMMNAVPVPASHLYDTFSKKQSSEIVESRYNCNLCHAPMTNARPIIGNTFKPNFRNELDKKKSNLLDVLNEGADLQ